MSCKTSTSLPTSIGTRGFLEINPRGTIPALVCEDGVVVCETIAIMLYLSDKHELRELAPGPTERDRGALLDWLTYHAVEVQEPVKRSFYAHRHARSPEEEAEVRERADALFLERWRLVEQHLQASGSLSPRRSLQSRRYLSACLEHVVAQSDSVSSRGRRVPGHRGMRSPQRRAPANRSHSR